MKIIFVSNYMTHHQLPLCNLLYEWFGNDFFFVATMPIEKERSDLGFVDFNTEFEFIVRTYDGPVEQLCIERAIMNADVNFSVATTGGVRSGFSLLPSVPLLIPLGAELNRILWNIFAPAWQRREILWAVTANSSARKAV